MKRIVSLLLVLVSLLSICTCAYADNNKKRIRQVIEDEGGILAYCNGDRLFIFDFNTHE